MDTKETKIELKEVSYSKDKSTKTELILEEQTNSDIETPKPFTFDRVVRILFTVILIGAALWLIETLRNVLLPFVIAWLIAYMLEPLVQYNKRLLRMQRRWLPVFMSLFEFLLLIIAACAFMVPSLANEAQQVAVFLSQYSDAGSDIPFIPASVHQFLQEHINFKQIASELTRENFGTISDYIGNFIAGGVGLIMSVFNWFLVILYVIFIMLDYDNLLSGFYRLVPPKHRNKVFRIGNNIKNSMNHYFRGQALIAGIVGILFCIGFLIIDLPLAIIMGIFIGILNMVPYLQTISLIPASLLCLIASVDPQINFWHLWLSCMAVYIVVQCIQDLFLTPKIMGKAMSLNPAIILLSLSVWGTLLGFIGLIIALPLTSLLLSYYNEYITRYKKQTKTKK